MPLRMGMVTTVLAFVNIAKTKIHRVDKQDVWGHSVDVWNTAAATPPLAGSWLGHGWVMGSPGARVRDPMTHSTPGGGVWLMPTVSVRAIDFRCVRYGRQPFGAVLKNNCPWSCRH